MNTRIPELSEQLLSQTEKIIIGKSTQIRLMIMTLLSGGHVLLDDMPGVGKTTLVKALSIALGCDFRRLQFVPDLLPSDITGMNIFDQKTGAFRLLHGPVMTNILLADEINRAIPRTQAALLEAMEEKQVTIDSVTYPLPTPFIVMATQNPVESETTFRLPAAQMDRFLVRISLGYPDLAEEQRMLSVLGDSIPFDTLCPVTNAQELAALQEEIAQVTVSPAVSGYLVSLVQATRNHPLFKLGASPRGSRGLYKACKTWAAMEGRGFVTPDDVQTLAVPVLAHRLLLSSEARLGGKTASELLSQLLSTIPVPPGREGLFHEN